jgi:histidinol-phosphate aminotransferase
VIPSEANFVFAKPPAGSSAADVYAALRKRGIFTRYFPGPSTGDRLRISIGTDGEMSKLLSALDSETKSDRQKRERTRQ